MADSDLAEAALRLCRKRGAEQADALLIQQQEKAVSVFNQKVQLSGANETTRMIIRVFYDHRGAVIHGNVATEELLETLVNQVLTNLQFTSQDKYLGSAESSETGTDAPLELFDERLAQLPLNRVEEIALAAEQKIKEQDQRTENLITTSLQVQSQTVTLRTSAGFSGSYKHTLATLVANAAMDEPDQKNLGTANTVTRSLDGLDLAKTAERTLRQLTRLVGDRPAPAGQFPILFAPSSARTIASMLLQMCSGPATLFIETLSLGKAGDAVCSPRVTLVDDATRKNGIGSAPFDHEGVKPARKVIIEKGVLKDYLLNSYYGRSLRRSSTGNAVANGDARFGVRHTNAFIETGDVDPKDILADVKRGLLVTRFLSPAMTLSMNFTQAVEGFWIEDGKVSYPVRAAAIAAPLRSMLEGIVAVGKDLDPDAAVASPTLLVNKMNVSSLM
ncbi:MAG TPA: TldD/PmbA family protein [Pyrinomonadaceae bacterium]|nr:TldD/PmbA family protein [Pyrinomonadaceae bacterium]